MTVAANDDSFDISPVVEADAARVLEHCEAIAPETDFLTFGVGEFGVSLDEEIGFIRAYAEGGKGLMLKAVVGTAIVGMATLTRNPRPRVRHTGELGLSVRRAFWGRGIGTALCRRTFEEARALGFTRVTLRVRADNTRALRLYEQLGFVVEGRIAAAMVVDGVEHDDLAMALSLRSST